MIKLGKVFRNRMVDLSVTNKKLLDRGLRIVMDLANVDRSKGIELLSLTKGSVKLALLISYSNLPIDEASNLLEVCDGNLKLALKRSFSL